MPLLKGDRNACNKRPPVLQLSFYSTQKKKATDMMAEIDSRGKCVRPLFSFFPVSQHPVPCQSVHCWYLCNPCGIFFKTPSVTTYPITPIKMM